MNCTQSANFSSRQGGGEGCGVGLIEAGYQSPNMSLYLLTPLNRVVITATHCDAAVSTGRTHGGEEKIVCLPKWKKRVNLCPHGLCNKDKNTDFYVKVMINFFFYRVRRERQSKLTSRGTTVAPWPSICSSSVLQIKTPCHGQKTEA